jgi:hypothetical protein
VSIAVWSWPVQLENANAGALLVEAVGAVEVDDAVEEAVLLAGFGVAVLDFVQAPRISTSTTATAVNNLWSRPTRRT